MGRPSVRQQLVDASLDVFQTHGFNGASVQDLTDAAGVPKGSFYNHFGSKEELALEALKLYTSQHGLEALLDERQSPVERLKRHFRANWKYFKDRGYRSGCFLGALTSEIADSHDTARGEFVRYFHLWSAAIAKVVAQGQSAGEIAAGTDPQLLGRFVLNAWQGTLVRAKASKNEEPFKDFVTATFGVVLASKSSA